MSGAYEVLDLIARWVHVVAGIMWVGNSMLFNWLDRNLRSRADPGVYGDIWLLHSGGFYIVEKNQGERTPDGGLAMPAPLHWFKWQAYTTWISGAALLVIVYYAGGRALLAHPDGIAHSTSMAALIAVGTIVVGFAAYEGIWRTLGGRAPRAAGLISLVLLIVVIQWLLSQLDARAAFLHLGALLGTIMAGNVAMTIMPSQRELVAALAEGRTPSHAIADRAKMRSIHNNYLTFPVILFMVSAHFPAVYSHRNAGLLALALIGAGAGVRHFMNIRFTQPRWRIGLAATLAISVALLAAQLIPASLLPAGRDEASGVATDTMAGMPDSVMFADARRIIDRRCTACHSIAPSDVSLGVRPGGIAFDTPEQIEALAGRIRERAVVTRTMPPANKTRMTEGERQFLRRWLDARD